MRPRTLRLDLLSAYGVSGARIATWVVVTAIIFPISPAAYALLVLIRTTLGLLNYTAMGLGPAMVHHLAHSLSDARTTLPIANGLTDLPVDVPATDVADQQRALPWDELYRNGLFAAVLAALIGIGVIAIYNLGFDWFFDRPQGVIGSVSLVVWCIGGAGVLRLFSDVPGAAITTSGHITLDNLIQIMGEAVIVAVALIPAPSGQPLLWIAVGLLIGAATVMVLRLWSARIVAPADRATDHPRAHPAIHGSVVRTLLTYGLFVTAAALADYLYAPTDLFLINRMLDPIQIAVYAPAIQIDAALFLTVNAIAAVIFPHAAVAFAARDMRRVRALYFWPMFFGAVILLGCAVVVILFSRQIFMFWLRDPMMQTQAIIPLMMVSTVMGASAAVGRSILLAIGKVRALTIAAVASGLLNLLASATLVYFTDLGLKAIVLGTIIAVVARCALWMPWYILQNTRSS